MNYKRWVQVFACIDIFVSSFRLIRSVILNLTQNDTDFDQDHINTYKNTEYQRLSEDLDVDSKCAIDLRL